MALIPGIYCLVIYSPYQAYPISFGLRGKFSEGFFFFWNPEPKLQHTLGEAQPKYS